MKKANEIYDKNGYYEDYNPMLEAFGKILIKYDDDAYQGDSYVLYELESGKYGILIFGWGSCSGCDALMSCDSIKEVQALMDILYNSIKQFDTLTEVKEYMNEDRVGFYSRESNFKLFKKAVSKYKKKSKN